MRDSHRPTTDSIFFVRIEYTIYGPTYLMLSQLCETGLMHNDKVISVSSQTLDILIKVAECVEN